MKLYLLITFVLISSSIYSQRLQDSIHWNVNYRITWDDFQGFADTTSTFGALSYCGLDYDIKTKDSVIQIKVYAYFRKDYSWSKYKTNTILLKHEQGHFDIIELYARKLRKIITNYSGANIKQFFLTKIKEIKVAMQDYNSLYDRETDLSKNLTIQKQWTKQIALELKKMEKFKYSPQFFPIRQRQ